jgi:hypothetical protein
MGLLGWFKRGGGADQDRRLREWREGWEVAARAADADAVARLRSELDALALADDDIEIEREMLEGLEHVATISAAIDTGGLPSIETGHRVVGADACHFTTPASMPDEPSQPGGRLFLTSVRAIFVGGPGANLPWHSLVEAIQTDRDLVLVRVDRERMYRFRCNSYSDALTAALLARRLIAARRGAPLPGRQQ